MDTPRRIIHLDLDAFYCAVEEQRDPRLQGKAFAVGGRPDERGVIDDLQKRFGSKALTRGIKR